MIENEQMVFIHKISRHLARKKARKHTFDSIQQCKDFLKLERNNFSEHPKLRSLVEELMTPNGRMIALLEEVIFEINNKYQIPDLGIILIGSNANGGSYVSELSDRNDPLDLDYIFISSNRKILLQNQNSMREEVTNLVDQLKSKHGIDPRLCVCDFNDGQFQIGNIKSVEEIKKNLIENILSSGLVGISFFLYFNPSVPFELNLLNQQKIMIALQEVFKENPVKWEMIKNILISGWHMKGHHKIKEKYLGDPQTLGDIRLAKQVADQSMLAMSLPFMEFIENTKVSSS